LPAQEPERLPELRVFVHRIVVRGSTVFSAADLARVTGPYVNRTVTSEELEALRLALTQLYVKNGYVNSGAVLPDQTVHDGVIQFQIIEGELTRVDLTNVRWFRKAYLRRRLTLDVGIPLKISTLQERLQQLQQDDRIARLEAELQPGVRLGESELRVRVEEHLPYTIAVDFNNYQSPTVGAERGQLTAVHRNITGYGDILQLTTSVSAGTGPQLDASYTVPLSPRETIAQVRYRLNVSSVIEEPFDALDFQSRSEIATLTLRHPLYRTLHREFALVMSAEHLYSKTTLSDIPFNTPGTEDGALRITVLRLTMEWITQTSMRLLAIRSRFSLGVDLLDATVNTGEVPSGKFFAWLGQFQMGQRLWNQRLEFLLRMDAQLTTDPLFPLEQLAIGGRFSVRGYRENQLVRDNAFLTSLEVRVLLLQNQPWAEYVQLVPFVDFGWGENRRVPTPSVTTLTSIGLGLRWAIQWQTTVPAHAAFEIFWGHKLNAVDTPGGDLQDRGLHLQFVLTAF
jgi:hemolysin activation/secretion protein